MDWLSIEILLFVVLFGIVLFGAGLTFDGIWSLVKILIVLYIIILFIKA